MGLRDLNQKTILLQTASQIGFCDFARADLRGMQARRPASIPGFNDLLTQSVYGRQRCLEIAQPFHLQRPFNSVRLPVRDLTELHQPAARDCSAKTNFSEMF